METIKFKNGGDRHVYFENGFIVCVETGIKSKLAECYKNFDNRNISDLSRLIF